MRKAIVFKEYRYALDFAYLWRTYEYNQSYVRNPDEEVFILSISNLSLDEDKDTMIYLLENGDRVDCFQYEPRMKMTTLLESKMNLKELGMF